MRTHDVPSYGVRHMVDGADQEFLKDQRIRREINIDLAVVNLCLTAIIGLMLVCHILFSK